jgi:hypothetical protein
MGFSFPPASRSGILKRDDRHAERDAKFRIPCQTYDSDSVSDSVSDLPKSTNFDIGALCLDIPESMPKDCSIM